MTPDGLALDDCSFSYGPGGFALRGVSLSVHSGEVLGIVGPNGSGKSTLLRLMAGFLRPAAGRASLDGSDLRGIGRRELARQLAFLPQSPETAFRFRVGEVVAMGRYPYQGAFGFLSEEDSRAVERAMRETETEGLAPRIFSTLSGGEKQRALIAGILAQDPSVMLLDEPTGALDIHHQTEVLDLLWRLSRQGIAVALVTHDLNAAAQFCDRLALLSDGELVRLGPAAEVLQEDLLSEVYGAPVRIIENPFTHAPLVLVLGEAAHEAR
ncbi:MAG: ABC transporter ATP-binding protein [Candidatus Brocadiia bacterium]